MTAIFDTSWQCVELECCLDWIHFPLPQSERNLLREDAQRRLARCPPLYRQLLLPLVKCDAGNQVAASYFKILSGNVATLGGVRAAPDWEQTAVDMLKWQVDALRKMGLAQVQAIVHEDDWRSNEFLRQSGLKRLTCVEHQWLNVQPGSEIVSAADAGLVATRPMHSPNVPVGAGGDELLWRWRPASDFAHSRLALLLENTFLETLDCPAMNGRRDRREVLQGFLDGRSLRQTTPYWEVLEIGGKVVGCLLLQKHAPELIEFVYMGLLPQARGQGLGRALVRRALETARRHECQNLVVAVDEQNWPAIDVYRSFGFRSQQRLQVWMAD